QARIGARRRCGDDAKILVVRRTADGIRRRKLCAIEDIEELGAKFQAKAFIGAELSSLKDGKIEVVDSLRAQSRVHTRLVAKVKVRRRGKARGLKPAQDGEVVRVAEARGSAAGSARIAAGNDVASRAAAEQRGSVGLAIGEDQRKTALKNRDTVESPTAYKSVRRGADVGPIPSALADGKIHHVADHQALRYVLRGKGALSGRV